MKKIGYGLFIGLALLACLTLSVGMLLVPPSQSNANEKLASAPALYAEDGSFNLAVLADTVQWINDHFFLRSQMISADRWLTGNLLATSGEPSVVLGKNGWLFYEPTVVDFVGIGGLTEQELGWAAHNLSLMARYCEENGKDFLFVIAPNKNSLYGQYMPDYGVTPEVRDAQRLQQLLREKGVPCADMFAAFQGQQEELYFAHDSHWNSKGAALGADVINQGFGLQSCYFDGDFSRTEPHTGDLYAMLYPGFADPETNPVYGSQLDFHFTGRASQADAITLETEGQGQGRLLAYRDSFGNLLYPYLADSSRSARFSRSATYDLTLDADRVLIELVERNLSWLITYVPVMPAPEAEVELPAEAVGTLPVQSTKRSGLVQLQGTLPEVPEQVWVVAEGAAYEAFLLSDGRFGVNVPENVTWTHVVYKAGDALAMYEMILEVK